MRHTSHVILLPQSAGWEWYHAVSDYVMRFRPTLTQSADDAISFRGASHTITAINPAAWNRSSAARQPGQEDDIITWLKDPRNIGSAKINIDLIAVIDPAALRRVLAERILKSDRYGRVVGGLALGVPGQPAAPLKPEEQPLKLVWPTDYRVFTQKFGERPEYYTRFGLPGHEGVDIRAPNGSNVYACADGLVTLAGWRAPNHAYGYSVRIRHKRGDGDYETIYAHLQEGSAAVNVGDSVIAGQLIGLGDNTGNSSASHLHLSLKKLGAKNGGYGEIVDPEPFFAELPR